MSTKSHISPKTKKILVGVGVGFGTVMVFLVSFILAFSLIVNPINFMTVSESGAKEENEKLKTQVQTLEDEVEMLNSTVDKYKNSQSSTPTVQAPVVVQPSTQQQSSSQTGSAAEGSDVQNAESSSGESDLEESGDNNSEGSGFTPETSTSTGEDTPEDVENPITVIDISE